MPIDPLALLGLEFRNLRVHGGRPFEQDISPVGDDLLERHQVREARAELVVHDGAQPEHLAGHEQRVVRHPLHALQQCPVHRIVRGGDDEDGVGRRQRDRNVGHGGALPRAGRAPQIERVTPQGRPHGELLLLQNAAT